jgi:hypothetical protein
MEHVRALVEWMDCGVAIAFQTVCALLTTSEQEGVAGFSPRQ